MKRYVTICYIPSTGNDDVESEIFSIGRETNKTLEFIDRLVNA